MSVLSIRSMPKELEKAIIQQAKKSGKTKTQVVLELLKKQLGFDEKSQRKKKLLKFFGKMDKKEYEEIDKRLKVFSEIDEEMWK
ncbi:MAG: hypothetical protein HQM15_07420 [Deltaproteobacteria bacterium]|nr:hypothetical protein [Deltaproteobacteria bacterium]